jgi:hypothetical protein
MCSKSFNSRSRRKAEYVPPQRQQMTLARINNEHNMKEVKIEPTLLNQSNSAYTNPTFTVLKVRVPKFEFSPSFEYHPKPARRPIMSSN